MRKTRLCSVIGLLMMGVSMFAENCHTLWTQYQMAMAKDLPKTAMGVLQQIEQCAKNERLYGDVLRAGVLKAKLQVSIAPDSLKSEVERIEQAAHQAQAEDAVLGAVYESVLGQIYSYNSTSFDQAGEKSKACFQRSMQNPSLLAAVQASQYEPLLTKGVDSRIFNNDLLHVIGFAAGEYRTLYDYYWAVGNRAAACICASEMLKESEEEEGLPLNQSRYVQQLDSFINLFSDLPEAGELAIMRYQRMANTPHIPIEELVRYIDYALSRWGSWKGMNTLRNVYRGLTNPSFSAEVRPTAIPGKAFYVPLNEVRNVRSISLHVWRLPFSGDYKGDPNNSKVYAALRKRMKPVPEAACVRNYHGKAEYQLTNDSVAVAALPVGVYLLELAADNPKVKPIRSLLYVSNVLPLLEEQPGKKVRMVVVDATTGHPVPNAQVRLKTYDYYNEKTKIETLTCGENGEVMYSCSKREPSEIYVYTPTDKAFKECSYEAGYSFYSSNKRGTSAFLYTDRSIYRPGQTVQVAAIVFDKGPDLERKAKDNATFQLKLYDANYKVIEEKEVTTDAFGKAHTEFSLPTGKLTGQFSIRSSYGNPGNVWFRVEEYKRPTFEVSFPEVNQKYMAGDTVEVVAHAKTYAGVPVQGAKVSYTVKRRSAFWWSWYGGSIEAEQVFSSTDTTNAEGGFKVRVPMQLPKGRTKAGFYSFEVSATVTDLGGESRQGSISLPLGSKPTALMCNLPQKIEKDSLKSIVFTFKNAAGTDLEGRVRYYINKVKISDDAATNQAIPFDVSALPVGKHHFKAICETDTVEQDFVLFTLQDTKPVVETKMWSYQSSASFRRDGRPVQIQLGSSQDDLRVFYSIFSGQKVLESGVKTIDNSLLNEQFTYRPEYGDGIVLTYAWVKDGCFYTEHFAITRAMPDKRLIAEWKTFRNKLTPGQKEEWTLHLKHPDGRPATAQVMATMYDQSLEQMVKHRWSLHLGYGLSLPNARWDAGLSSESEVYDTEMPTTDLEVEDLDFYNFRTFELNWYEQISYMFSRALGSKRASASYAEAELKDMAMEKMAGKDANGEFAILAEPATRKVMMTGSVVQAKNVVGNDEANEDSNAANDSPTTNVSIRENLNETAFFYPTLTSDQAGDVSIQFTLPESITTWRFMSLATDKEMNHTALEGEAIAKKTVMIQPNMPRFLRLGDKGLLAAKLFNTSEKDVTGTAKIELIDPETDRMVYFATKNCTVKAGETSSVDFDLNLLQGSSLYRLGTHVWICRLSITGKGYSDGEQHYLPVLSDKERVTNSIAFTQMTKGIKTIDLEKLFAVKEPGNRLTIEYTNNPAWLMIQALPYVSEVHEDDAISLATAYYANSIARYLLTNVPEIKRTIALWKQEQGRETSLMSHLQKNEELKTVVLDETPWVVDAYNETQQKLALIRYFDENSIGKRLQTCIDKLQKLQNPDGSWSWFPGMRGSSYVTMAVAEMLVRLQTMIGSEANTDRYVNRSFRFMNKNIRKEAAEMRKQEKEGWKNVRPSEWAVRYLYLSSLTDPVYYGSVREDRDYMIDRLSKQTIDLTIYGKAVSAVILAKNGHVVQGKEYLQSIREYMVYKEEMGRYFDTPNAHYSWFDYKIPTQVAAIEAIKAIEPEDTQTLDDLKRWLLQEKRTQVWDTPINSSNAVYAFLNGDMETLRQTSASQTRLSVNGKSLSLPQATAGLGYVKVTTTGANLKTFSADKTSMGTSWGAVYAQFMQKTTDIADASMGLTISREILDTGELKVGDKVKVRITVVADRDYDFVQIVDKRAACMEPVRQLSGYGWGYYCTPRDNATYYYIDGLSKGKHTFEAEYYIDRRGTFSTGTCTVQCAYSPAYMARTKVQILNVK